MSAAGIEFTGQIYADGKLHRIKADGDHQRNSWYLLHGGPPAAGAFGCWKRSLKETWRDRNGDLSQSDWHRVRQQWDQADAKLKAETAARQNKANKIADWILSRANPVTTHAYLNAKKVESHGDLREYRDTVVLPLRDTNGKLHSLQFIGADGSKNFLTGGRVAGCFFTLADKAHGPLVICEGYATGASIHEATGCAVLCAINCGNLLDVAKAARELWPQREIIVAADNDQFTNGNPGLTKATAAAKAIRAKLAVPQFKNTAKKATDFNDLATVESLARVKEQIEAAEGAATQVELEQEPKKTNGRKSAATLVIELADGYEFFHDLQNRPFVRLEINGHVEIWPVNGSQFRNLLASTYYKRTSRAINRNAIADAVNTLAGRACHDSPEESVFLRVAPHGGNILIDFCDAQWRVIEVRSEGWRVMEKSPVAFVRSNAMRALPEPVANGPLDPLWELLNVTPAQRPLVAGALLNYFHPNGPYFVLNLVGEQGTAKSCAARIIRQIIDPSENPLRSPPREERDLIAQAGSNWCVAFDNLSSLPPWLSDGLCRLSTGGGHSARALYTDLEEVSLAIKRPVILNGIEDVATRPDLAERALQIELETIQDRQRISEKELWRKFETARPLIFSALLGGLVCALRESPNITLDSMPRMADPALWATAGEVGLSWKRGTFMAAYMQNLNEGSMASLEASPVGVAICRLLEEEAQWSGEPAELLETLDKLVIEEQRRAPNWPKNPRALSGALRRLAPAFRRAGIQLEHGRAKRRQIKLCKIGNLASPASAKLPDRPADDANDANDESFRPLHNEDAVASRELVEEFV